jgi:hypothetical protein
LEHQFRPEEEGKFISEYGLSDGAHEPEKGA